MFDSKEMCKLGFAFLNAGEVNLREGVIKNRSEYQNVAGIVNLAFACELFMKCLLNIAGKETKGHKIEELWQEYKATCEDRTNDIKSLVMKRLVTEMSFEDMLHDDSNIFYNYRYFYDPDRLSEIRSNPLRAQFLRVLVYELYGYISELVI